MTNAQPHNSPSSLGSASGALLAASAAVLWGTAGTAQTFITGGLPPVWLGALRLAVAALFFGALIATSRLLHRREDAAAASPLSVRTLGLALLAGAAIGSYNLLFFAGVKAAGIAVGTSLVIGSAPVWAGLLQSLRTRRAPKALWCAGVAAAATGLAALSLSQASAAGAPLDEGAPPVDLAGLALCLAAGLSYALYALISKPLVARCSPLNASALTFAAALAVTAAAAYALEGPPAVTRGDALVVLYLGLVATGAAYLLFTTGLKRISAATGVAVSLVEPAAAFVFAVTIAGEPFTAVGFAGFLAILAGLALILRADART